MPPRSALGVALLLVACNAPRESPSPQAHRPTQGALRACVPIALDASLDSVVRAIVANIARAGSNAYVLPQPGERDAFASAVVAALSGDAVAACGLPESYRTFSLRDGVDGILFVAELDESGQPAPEKYWGSYFSRAPSPGTRALIVEAPHPLFDRNTPYEARAVFSEARADWMLIAGAHRCANDDGSGCDGTTTACGGESGPYRESDTAHATSSPFFAVHAVLTRSTDDVFLQLHGNAQRCPDALFSDSSGAYADAGVTAHLAAALEAKGTSVGRCGLDYPKSGCTLCGTDNVEARMTAGSSDACTTKGHDYGRFVHLEQRPRLRDIPDGGTTGYQPVIDAVLETFTAR